MTDAGRSHAEAGGPRGPRAHPPATPQPPRPRGGKRGRGQSRRQAPGAQQPGDNQDREQVLSQVFLGEVLGEHRGQTSAHSSPLDRDTDGKYGPGAR